MWIGLVGKVVVYEKNQIDLVTEFKAHRSSVVGIVVGPDGRIWTISSSGTNAILWDPKKFTQIKQVFFFFSFSFSFSTRICFVFILYFYFLLFNT